MQIVQGQYLSNYLRSLHAALEHAIQTMSKNQLLNANENSHIASLTQKYIVEPIQLHLDREYITEHQISINARNLPPHVRVARGINSNDPRLLSQNMLVYHLPFSGDASLLQYDPSYSCRMSLPRLTIENSEITFEVAINENQPDEAGNTIKTYKKWLQQQVGYINADLAPHNASLIKHSQQLVNKKMQERIKLSSALSNIGIPIKEINTVQPDDNHPSTAPHNINKSHYSVAISYGGTDELVAAKLNTYLKQHEINTWFFPDDAIPGDKLHRTMFEMANNFDRVLLICSKESLNRSGLLNELERVLEREAKEGGSKILIPITLDNHVYSEWAPSNRDIADQIRSRVIGKLNVTNFECEETQNQLVKILSALTKKH